MEFANQNITSEGVCLVDNKQFAVDCRISELVDENVAKILCLDAASIIDGYDLLNGEVKFKGKINYKLMYVDENGEVKALNYLCDFSDSILSKELSSTDKICLEATVTSCSSSGLDIIKLSAIVFVKVIKVCMDSVEVIEANDDNCYYKTEEISYNSFVTASVSSFEIEDEYQTAKPIDDILMYDTDVLLCDVTPSENKIMLSGDVNANVTYKTEGGIATKTFNVPFSEEIEGANTPEGQCVCKLNIADAKVILGDNDSTIKIKLAIDARCMIFEANEVKIVNDMYSMTNRLELKKEKITIQNILGYKCFSERIATEAVLDNNMTGNIISVVCPKNSVEKVTVEDNILTAAGTVTACLLYRQEDKVNSVALKAPYSVELGEVEDGDWQIEGTVTEITAKAKNENVIALDALLKFACKGKNYTEYEAVVSAEDKGELPEKDCAISIIVISRPLMFFDVAKQLATTPEELSRQNPSLIEPLKLGDKLYFYRKLKQSYC